MSNTQSHHSQPTIPELRIIDQSRMSLFDRGERYRIPLYQRAYAWGEREIEQLIDDLCDIGKATLYDLITSQATSAIDRKYYLGSLVVNRYSDAADQPVYEVIDGQQRLTTLFILLRCLGYPVAPTLDFECRTKSSSTLHAENFLTLQKTDSYSASILDARGIILDKLNQELSISQSEPRLSSAIQRIVAKMRAKDPNAKLLIKNLMYLALPKVVLYRIEVPIGTDLNHYFEIMNTRGEQLEQHDVLKAKLMSYLSNEQEKAAFAAIWEACSDMTGYVPMHFHNTALRRTLFGSQWTALPDASQLNSFQDAIEVANNHGQTISDLIKDPKARRSDPEDEDDDRSSKRFEGIIEFPYFLLHALRIFAWHDLEIPKTDPLIPQQLDDKRLVESFEDVIKAGKLSNHDFAAKFIRCLLRCRFLFDQYIIKREHTTENIDGDWSLKSLSATTDKRSSTSKKPKYTDTDISGGKDALMLQACLRVSYTSPKVMHWITTLLSWLYQVSQQNPAHFQKQIATVAGPDGYVAQIEHIARQAVADDFLNQDGKSSIPGRYSRGVGTPRIVFNYLDYLLWHKDHQKSRGQKYSNFKFEFRNSVEHWYPQHPDEDPWNDQEALNDFGNLCLMPRNENSKFSNLHPAAKKSQYHKSPAIQRGSIKLRIMAEEITAEENANQDWRDQSSHNGYYQHGKNMIALLRSACQSELASLQHPPQEAHQNQSQET